MTELPPVEERPCRSCRSCDFEQMMMAGTEYCNSEWKCCPQNAWAEHRPVGRTLAKRRGLDGENNA